MALATSPAGNISGTLANVNRLASTSSVGVIKESQISDGVTGSVLTIAGTLTAARTVTLPDAAVTIPAGTLLTGTLANANRLDSTSAAGIVKESQIADGVTGNVLTIAGTLTAARTLTFPDGNVTIPAGTLITGTLANANRLDSTSAAGVIKESLIADGISTSVLTIAGTLTAPRTLTLPDAAVTIPTGTLLTGTLANANRLDSTSAAGVVKESQIADGVTGSVLTISGTLTGLRTQTARDASGNLCLDTVNNAFTVAQTIGTDPGGTGLLRVGGSGRIVGDLTVIQTTGVAFGRLTTADVTSYSELQLANTGASGRRHRAAAGGGWGTICIRIDERRNRCRPGKHRQLIEHDNRNHASNGSWRKFYSDSAGSYGDDAADRNPAGRIIPK